MSRYVKLTKDQDSPMEEIRPGELNQPVRVPQVLLEFLKNFSLSVENSVRLACCSNWKQYLNYEDGVISVRLGFYFIF